MAMVPVCLILKQYHVLLAVLGGAITYAVSGWPGRIASHAALEIGIACAASIEHGRSCLTVAEPVEQA